ncbi:MAG: DapH/DapD/GlmU-related protein [Planctomycetota bacterium]
MSGYFRKIAVFGYVCLMKWRVSCYTVISLLRFKICGVKSGRGVRVSGRLNLHISPNSKVVLGNNVRIISGFAYNAVGGSQRTGFWVNRGAELFIGNDVGISNSTIVCSERVSIGEKTFIGGDTCIYDTNFHSLKPEIRLGGDYEVKTAPITIGKECFIGGHVIILKGVTIGDQSVVGAGSVVTHDIPPRQIWGGNPAGFIRMI